MPNFIAIDVVSIGDANMATAFCDNLRVGRDVLVSIYSAANDQPLVAPGGIVWRSPLFCSNARQPLIFKVVGTFDKCILRLAYPPPPAGTSLHLNFRDDSGWAELYDNESDGTMSLIPTGGSSCQIFSVARSQYLYYVRRGGAAFVDDRSGQMSLMEDVVLDLYGPPPDPDAPIGIGSNADIRRLRYWSRSSLPTGSA